MEKTGSAKAFKFSSEHLLQQAIAGLLSRMPNVTGVQILQGAQEYGKDIIFYVPGGLTDRLLCACVVKNTKITGQVATSSGARTVLLQAQQALDTPHGTGTGQDEYVQRVYVITPHPIDPAAIAAIQGALREKRGLVTFIGGPALFDLFRKYWADFAADEADAISRYLADVKHGFEQSHPIVEVATMYQLGAIDTGSTWIHVPQFFQRTIATYSPGDAIDQMIPDISLKWTRRNLHNAISNLHRLETALKTVTEWGFWTTGELQSFHKRVETLCGEMTVAWKKAVQLQFRVSRDAVDKISPDASVLVSDPQIKESLDELKFKADLALASGVDRISGTVADIIGDKLSAEMLLIDRRFLEAAALNDFADALPPEFLRREHSQTWQFEPDFVKNNSSLLIVGSAGYGKTSFCRWSFLNDAEQFRCGKTNSLPVYVPLHKIAKTALHTFDDVFRASIGRSGLLDGVDPSDALRLKIYLDGLDEVADEKTREQIVSLAQQGIISNPNIQVVITARSYVQGHWLRWLPRLSLSGFNDGQIDLLIREWFEGRDDEATRFISQLQSMPGLKELMRVPLLATLIILVFRQTRRLPESRPRLYDVFIDLMCEGWNLAKGLLRTSRFGPRVKKAVLGRIAIISHRRKSRSFRGYDIQQAIKACVAKEVCSDWTELKEELLQDGLITSSGLHFEFAHLSFQEFLAARQLLGEPSHTLLQKALNDYLRGDDWWLETLRFYVGLSAAPRETYNWIVKQAGKLSEDNNADLQEDPSERAEALLASIRQTFPEAPMML